MSIEQKINQQLNNHPAIKRGIKRVYQRAMYTISPKIKSEGEINRISPDDISHEYFFGYYDKSPEDATGRYVLCLKADNTWSDVAPRTPAQILLIDTYLPDTDPARVKVLAETHTWNVQQGCMLQWLGPDYNREIIYNDFRDGKYCSVVLDVFSGMERVLAMPVYSVSADGSFALTLNFSRLHRLRPGYGYSNLPETTAEQKIPNSTAVWKLDIKTNTVTPVLNYSAFANFESRPEMKNAEHKVNHIMLNPSGTRFMVLHRWFDGSRKYTRLVTVNVDGTDMYNLSDDDMVSHCYWKNDEEIIAFESKKGQGAGYFLMKDKSPEYRRLWPHISSDGHPSYSPDGRLVLTDTYPNRKRMAILKILNEDFNIVIAKVFAPFKYDNDTRCDLHPRWSRDGKKVYFDSVFEGHRGLYTVDVSRIRFAHSEMTATALTSITSAGDGKNDVGKRIRIVYLMTSCRKSGPTQVVLNIIKNLNHNTFEPILVTLYDEESDSQMADILPYVSAHYLVKTGKKDIVLGQDGALKKKLEELKPDVIHSTGVFPDYAVSRIAPKKQMITLHNYVYEDYLAKFGTARGTILAKLQLSAIHRAACVVACSESLSKIYKEKLNLDVGYIRNGVDVEIYSRATDDEKKKLRKKLGIPSDAYVFIYTGQFIERKNVPFLLENYVKAVDGIDRAYLILLGDGSERADLQRQYSSERVDFRGSVNNVNEYLRASDVYVSTSKSEGLPNGVLEAMATGLPVVLSDIWQHLEIIEVDNKCGFSYYQGNNGDFIDKLRTLVSCNYTVISEAAYRVAHFAFNAKSMSKNYQEKYKSISGVVY